jgi:hypothetical protein
MTHVVFLIFSVNLFHLSSGIYQYPYKSISSSFLPHRYLDLGDRKEYSVRQVPGHGSCLFDALSVCYQHHNTSQHQPYSKLTSSLSKELRKSAVEILLSNETLSLTPNQTISSLELLELTAQEYNVTPSLYCEMMLKSHTWGGGPEILAISRLLNCSIDIYEACHREKDPIFYLSKSCTLGSSTSRNHSLKILFVDGRFPNLSQEEIVNSRPDHFLALFENDGGKIEPTSMRPRHRLFARGRRWLRRSS